MTIQCRNFESAVPGALLDQVIEMGATYTDGRGEPKIILEKSLKGER